MALVTLGQLKSRLGISDTSKDDDLAGIIAGSQSLVRKYLGYDPETTGTQSELLAPMGAELLTLRKVPPGAFVTLTAVYEDTSQTQTWDSTTLLTADQDYTQERPGGAGIIRLGQNWYYSARRMPNRLGGVILPYTSTVKVTYTADLSDHLAVARRAALAECMAQASLTYDGKGVGLVTSDSMDGASVTINTSANPSTAKQGLNGFTSPVVAGWLKDFRLVALV